MNGRGHLFSGTVLAADALAVSGIAAVSGKPGFLAGALPEAKAVFIPAGDGAAFVLSCAACAALYYFGVLLPDIDRPNATVTKLTHFHLPLCHRGFTHSLWFVFVFLALGMFLWFPLRYVGIGMLAHDLADWGSTAGWVPFYPLGRWRKYQDCVMARGHWVSFYSSQAPGSETVVNVFLTVLSLACVGVYAWIAFTGGG